MTHVSRPLIALLAATVVFFALWMVALKPSSSSTGGANNPTSGVYQSAIAKAHRAVKIASGASAANGTLSQTTPATTTAPSRLTTKPASATKPATSIKPTITAAPVATSAAGKRVATLEQALRSGKVIALLFYNHAAADDRAVQQELTAVPTDGAKVVKLEVPLSELSRYTFVTDQVQVNSSPTLVLIDRAKQATTIVGFADTFEIAQRVTDTLASAAN
jgi:hypothetical protein